MGLLFPIRCFSCGKVIGHLWEEYDRRVKEGEEPAKVLDDLGITRYCCRRMFFSHVDLVDDVIQY
jgi:DNA-directed RNA polymerase subunit N